MATYDDLASGLNNSLGLSLADALAVRNNQPTLLEQKSLSVSQKLAEKQLKLDPNTQQPSNFLGTFESYDSGYKGRQTGLADLAEASMYRAGGNIADVGKSVSNNLFGTNFDDSEADGWSNAQTADDKAGVSLAYRGQLQQDQDQVLQDISQGNWLDAVMSAGNVAFRTAADSAATIPELAVGALLAPVAGAGVGVIGKKLVNAKETADKVISRYDQLKNSKVGSLVAKGLKESTKASVLTVDIVQQQRNQFKAENNGEEPTAARLAGMSLLTLATTIWQPQIANKLFMPKLKGKTTKADGDFRERFQKEIQGIVEKADNGVLKNLGIRVAEGVKGVIAAGGAEAVQEYAQFWAETLGVKMKPDEVTGFFESAAKVLSDQGIQDQAIQAAFLGGAAGGATKVALSTPGNLVGSAADTALSVSNKVQKKISNNISDRMSDGDILTHTAEHQTNAAEAKAQQKVTLDEAEVLGNVTSIDQVTNENVVDRLTKLAEGKDLTDPKVFREIQDSALRKMGAEVVASRLAIKKAAAFGVTERAYKAALERAKSVADAVLTPEVVKKIQGIPKVVKDTVISELEDFPRSTTAGLLEASGNYSIELGKKGTNYSKELTKEKLAELRVKSRQAGVSATTRLAQMLRADAPDVSKALMESARSQKNAAKETGTRTDNLTTSNSILPNVAKAISVGMREGSVNKIVSDIFEMTKGTFDSAATAKKVLATAEKVKETDAYKNMSEVQVRALNRAINKLTKVSIKRSETVVETVTDAANSVIDTVKKHTVDLIPEPKEGKTDSVKSKAIRALNEAFVQFTKETPATEETPETSETSETVTDSPVTIKVKEDPTDAKSKTISTFTASPKLVKLYQDVSSAALADKEKSTGHVTFNEIIDMIIVPAAIDVLAESIKSDDPRAIKAIYRYLAGDSITPEMVRRIDKNVDKVLGETENTVSKDGKITDDTNTKNLPNDKPYIIRGDGIELKLEEMTNEEISEFTKMITVCKD